MRSNWPRRPDFSGQSVPILAGARSQQFLVRLLQVVVLSAAVGLCGAGAHADPAKSKSRSVAAGKRVEGATDKERDNIESKPWVFPASALDRTGRWIESGVRLERDPSGGLRWSEQHFPRGGEAAGVPLPAHLGGGYLFYQPIAQDSSSGTALWRAESWTGTLEPLSTLPFSASELVAGFDRIYALSGGRQIAIDPASGQWLPLDPLPPVPTVERLRFLGTEVGVLQAPMVGVLATTDAGRTWAPVEGVLRLTDRPGIVVEADCADGTECSPLLGFSPDGTLHPHNVRAPTRPPSESTPRGAARASEIVLRGARTRSGVAALIEGKLLTLSRDGGLHSKNVAVPRELECQALADPSRGGIKRTPAVWFMCGQSTDSGTVLTGRGTHIYRLHEGQLAHVFASQTRPEFLAASDEGILLRGACRGESLGFCLVTPAKVELLRTPPRPAHDDQEVFALGRADATTTAPARPIVWRLRRVRQSAKAKQSVAPSAELEAGETAQEVRGHIEIHELSPGNERLVVQYPTGKELRTLLDEGSWLPGGKTMKSAGQEGIAFWVTRGSDLAGVFVSDDGAVRVGPIQTPLRRTFVAGRRALIWGAAGFAKETTDLGQTWNELTLPYESGDPDANLVSDASRDLKLGCSAAGCSIGRFLRVGWGGSREDHSTTPRIADTISIPPPGGARHRFTCQREGTVSAPAIEAGVASSAIGRRRGEVEGELVPFWEVEPPELGSLQVGYSVRDGRRLAQLDAWGKEQASWARTGRARIVFRDPFEVEGIMKSAPTVGLFPSHLAVQETLGVLDRSSRFASAELDPGGKAGVLLVRNRTGTALLSFQENKAIQQHPDAEEHGIRGISGAVLAKGNMYVSYIVRDLLHVARLAASNIEVIARLPLFDAGSRSAQVIRTTTSDLGVLIEADQGLMLYPLSEDGTLGQVAFVPHQGSREPSCNPEAMGFLFERDLPLAPHLEDARGDLNLNRVRARMIAGYGAPCLEAMAAETRGALRVEPGDPAPNAVPLVVTDLTAEGRRQLLLCH